MLTWTKELPTAAGYYWVRGGNWPAPPYVIHVRPDARGQLAVQGLYDLEACRGGEWAGPIPLPGEPAPASPPVGAEVAAQDPRRPLAGRDVQQVEGELHPV